jgi:hypothetical protein
VKEEEIDEDNEIKGNTFMHIDKGEHTALSGLKSLIGK